VKAITVKQPWAWAIAIGAKHVENRGRSTPWTSAVGTRIAIHAGRAWDSDAIEHPQWMRLVSQVAHQLHTDPDRPVISADLIWLSVPQGHHRGALLATALLSDVHAGETCQTCGPWAASDQWHLVLTDIKPMTPTPCKGALGLWTVPTHLLETA
jgi:hypothetical protein